MIWLNYQQKTNLWRIKKGSYDEKWLKENKTELSKKIDDEKSAHSVMSKMERQMKKQY